MKKLENMTIEEIIEFDKNNFVKPYNIIEAAKKDVKLSEEIGYYTTINYETSYNEYCEYRKNLPIYQELERSYNEILEKVLNELDKINLNEDTLNLIISLCNYLIPNSYLSTTDYFTRNFKYYLPNIFYGVFLSKNGSYIITGKGVCRHINGFISDILNIKGVENYLVSGELTSLRKKGKFKINHVINGIIENNKYYLIDGFNNYYNIEEKEDYFMNNMRSIFIPDYSAIRHKLKQEYKRPFYLLPYELPCSQEELKERITDIYKIMLSSGYQRFEKFKQENFDLYQRVEILNEIELHRTLHKEKQKVKRKRI